MLYVVIILYLSAVRSKAALMSRNKAKYSLNEYSNHSEISFRRLLKNSYPKDLYFDMS